MKDATFSSKNRVIVYIDGFNLYFGMTSKWRDVKWLDVVKLANNLLKPNQELVEVKYFTSRVSNNVEKQKRQTIYLEAIELQGASLIYGQYQANTEECLRCGNVWNNPKEKMTDVNIATHLIVDAMHDLYDTALLISGDSDLVPPVKAVHENFKGKQVVACFPPNRENIAIKKVVKGAFVLGRSKLKHSQLPLEITKPSGYVLRKPDVWP